MKTNCLLHKFLVGFFLLLCACTPSTPETPVEPSPEIRTLTVMTHDSFDVSEEIVRLFEAEHDAEVIFLKTGDTGTALTRAILAKDAPLADVFYGIDNTFLSRALDEDIFEPYESVLLAEIPDEFKIDPQNRALPVDFGDVCPNYDKRYFEERGLNPPKTLEDLIKPEFDSLLVVQNPATSSPGLAFLLATIGHFGEDRYLEFWQRLVENNVLVVSNWETAYYSEFSRWGGTRPIVISYGSSPPFEVIFAEEEVDEPPTGVITSDGACFRQIEFVGILKGTQNRDLAEKWIDFMLSPTFQEDMPLRMYVFPVHPEAHLDQIFMEYLAIPEKPIYLSIEKISANRENWIQAWTETVLR